MPSWRENVDPLIKEHLEAQIRETTKHQSTYLQAKSPTNAQLWIAIANLSKQILSLSLKMKYLENAMKDTIEKMDQKRSDIEPNEPISFVLDSKPLLSEGNRNNEEENEKGHIKVKEGEKRRDGFLYYVKGDNLDVYRTKMAKGRKKSKKTPVKKKKVKKSVAKIKKVKKGKRGRPKKRK